jgi:SPP1 gp7 family putative phage head morphogenesis protein
MRPEPYSRFTFDKRAPGERSFVQARKVERYYGSQLRKIARHIGEIVSGSPPSDLMQAAALRERLRKYAELITPWGRSVAERMLADVSRRDRDAWRSRVTEMGQLLRREIDTAPTGMAMRRLLQEQVALITSLPTEAGERVHRLTVEGLADGGRAAQVAEEIMRIGQVTRSRANLIARTEVGRAATTLTQTRAEHVGSTGYIWRTAGDSDVRESHRRMAGRFVAWDDAPVLDGLKGHAGALPNCRCYCEPVIPEF